MTEHAHHTTHTHKHPQENGLAIASFILGIVSFTGFGAVTGIPAIITGSMSLKNPVNKGLGIAGLIMGIVSTLFTILLIMFFVFLMIVAIASEESSTHDIRLDNSSGSSHTRSI